MKVQKYGYVAFVITCLYVKTSYSQENTAQGPEYRAQELGGVSAAKKQKSGRPITVSASLREEYDDNIFTTKTNKKAQFKTIIEPSILYNLPLDNTLLSARYTFGLTYFPDRGEKETDSSHEFTGRLNHSFTTRFNVDLRDRVRYSQEPQILEGGARTQRTNSSYLSNLGSIQGNMQWTPKLGTSTSYSNDWLHYEEKELELSSDRTVHTITHDFRYLLTPTITVVVGGFAHADDYVHANKDSNTIAGSFGADYSLTPQITVGARMGPSLTEFEGGGDFLTPYGTLYGSWILGARSNVEASFTHSVSETDLGGYFQQETDTFSFSGKYQFTSHIYGKAGGRLQIGNFDQDQGTTGTTTSFSENVYGVDLTLGYRINQFLDLETGYGYTLVSSDSIAREYDRNRIWIGIRGTY